jgi:hypothetical protein
MRDPMVAVQAASNMPRDSNKSVPKIRCVLSPRSSASAENDEICGVSVTQNKKRDDGVKSSPHFVFLVLIVDITFAHRLSSPLILVRTADPEHSIPASKAISEFAPSLRCSEPNLMRHRKTTRHILGEQVNLSISSVTPLSHSQIAQIEPEERGEVPGEHPRTSR